MGKQIQPSRTLNQALERLRNLGYYVWLSPNGREVHFLHIDKKKKTEYVIKERGARYTLYRSSKKVAQINLEYDGMIVVTKLLRKAGLLK